MFHFHSLLYFTAAANAFAAAAANDDD